MKKSFSLVIYEIVHQMTSVIYDFLDGRERVELSCFTGEQQPVIISVVPEYGTLFVSINGASAKKFLDLDPFTMGTIVDHIIQLKEDKE